MAFSSKELAAGEYVIFHVRAHWKVLVAPVVVLLASVAGWSVAWFKLIPAASNWDWVRWTVSVIAALLVIIWTLAPVIRWAARTDTLTNYRLISREGVFKREGRDIPMDRVHAVSYAQTVIERLLGAGTLIVQTAAQSSDVDVDDVAHVKKRQLQINEQLLNRDFEAVEPDSPASRAQEAAQRRFDGGEDTSASRGSGA